MHHFKELPSPPLTDKAPARGTSYIVLNSYFNLQEWEELSLKLDLSALSSHGTHDFLGSASTGIQNNGQWLPLSVGTSSHSRPRQSHHRVGSQAGSHSNPKGNFSLLLPSNLPSWLAAAWILSTRSASSSSRILSSRVPAAPELSHFLTQKPAHKPSGCHTGCSLTAGLPRLTCCTHSFFSTAPRSFSL